MAVGVRTDPYQGFRFRLEIDSIAVAGFSEATGLQMEIETEDFQEGGFNDHVHKLPKGIKYPNLILKRGLTDSDVLWKWFNDIAKRKLPIPRKNVRVFLLDTEGKEKLSWRYLQAHPIKWSGPDLKADSNSTAIEALELVHRGFERG